tara:strand:- start:833 stop:1111 length:279 start_codon:yes stop_codon:yes gene_type:complete
MISKILAFVGVVAFIGTILFYIYKEGQEKGKIQEIKQNQAIEIKIKDEIIIEEKQIIKRKEARNSITSDSNFNWLFKNRCKDCEGKRLLQQI